jgi:hypothetical protein
MRYLAIFLIALSAASWAAGQQQNPPAQKPAANKPAGKQPATSTAPATPPPETVQVAPTSQAPLQKPAGEAGYLEPAQVKALLHRMWLTEFRINDLLSQVRAEKWKISDPTRQSFNQTLETLRKQLEALEEWRAQFDKRPESMYFGYKAYAAINAVLPRLDGVARSVSQFENASLGAQYSQAGNQLFDQQQALEPYLSYLLRSQDGLLLASENNLAACQHELGYAMRGRTQPATPMKNVLPEFKGWRVRRAKEAAAGNAKPGQKTVEKRPAKKPAAKPATAKKSTAPAPSAKPGQKK